LPVQAFFSHWSSCVETISPRSSSLSLASSYALRIWLKGDLIKKPLLDSSIQ
jgi:hypothetical protein